MDSISWAQLAWQTKHYQTPDHQRAIEALRSLLNNDKLPSEIAHHITIIYAPSVIKSRQSNRLDGFWEIFCHAVRHVGASRQQSERLADMLSSIAETPDLLDEEGITVTDLEGKVYWRDLPRFSWCWRDYGNWENYNYILDENIDEIPEDDIDWYTQVEPLLAATTFSATFSARAPFDKGRQFDAQVALSNILPDPYIKSTFEKTLAEMIKPRSTIEGPGRIPPTTKGLGNLLTILPVALGTKTTPSIYRMSSPLDCGSGDLDLDCWRTNIRSVSGWR